MKYALLIYQDEQAWENSSEAEKQACYEEHGRFGAVLKARNAHHGGEELHPTTTATTVRRRGGEVLISDGPFAETAEQLGGLYIVEAADLDEAIELAKLLPEATIEVRAVVPHG